MAKKQQKIIYSDQVELALFIHDIQNNENRKKKKKKRSESIGFELPIFLSTVGSDHHYATASLTDNIL